MVKIESNEDKVWVISDPHFYHYNIIRYCHRPFTTVHEMNETIIKNWNDKVGEDEFIFMLGDFICGGFPYEETKKYYSSIYDRLNGNKFFLRGNHDKKLNKIHTFVNSSYENDPVLLFHKDRKILLNHIRKDFTMSSDVLFFFGHIHNRIIKDLPSNHHNVSVEHTGYAPVLIDDYL